MSQTRPALRICLVDCWLLNQGFLDLGHHVLYLNPNGGVFDLAAALAKHDFEPDLLIQLESLGPRTLLVGLESLRCPTLFWSVDGHLNFFWHRHYGRLFDAVLTTQPELVPEFRAAGCQAHWLPWCGYVQPAQPWFRRSIPVGFAARVGPTRPIRQNLVARVLEPLGAVVSGDIPTAELPQFHGDTMVAPNEAILGEINFRLFEATSAGCAVVTPAHDALPQLFEPGSEVLTYGDGLEMAEVLGQVMRDPARGEALGRAARLRVLREHLPVHRAATILELLSQLGFRATGTQAATASVLTRCWMFRDGRLSDPDGILPKLLAGLPDIPEVLAMRLRLMVEAGADGWQDKALDLVGAVAAAYQGFHAEGRDDHQADDTEILAAASLTAYRAGRLDVARHLLALHGQASGADALAETPKQLLRAWGRLLQRFEQGIHPGFPFDPGRHLPATAVECLLQALGEDSQDLDTARQLDQLLAGRPGFEATRLGLVSFQSLHAQTDWRLSLRLGLLDLKVFRLDEGLSELMLALEQAMDEGAEERFWRMVAAEGSPWLATHLKSLLDKELAANGACA